MDATVQEFLNGNQAIADALYINSIEEERRQGRNVEYDEMTQNERNQTH